ncbi:MAG: hypothetical protein OEW88_07205 [Gammaproteobacteria bacterium]|nr:hypothetical protein [Gammaproteobacteria bacterium]MDH5276194.1 hypothetical protein [Gammaproteobacteria bacterium]
MGRKAAVLATKKKAPLPEPQELLDPVDRDESELDDAADGDVTAEVELSDNVGEQSVEINVETLIAELEAETHRGRTRDVHCARRKLEDYLERKRVAHDIEDFEDFEIDD